LKPKRKIPRQFQPREKQWIHFSSCCCYYFGLLLRTNAATATAKTITAVAAKAVVGMGSIVFVVGFEDDDGEGWCVEEDWEGCVVVVGETDPEADGWIDDEGVSNGEGEVCGVFVDVGEGDESGVGMTPPPPGIAYQRIIFPSLAQS
jgi:hypothetical protein